MRSYLHNVKLNFVLLNISRQFFCQAFFSYFFHFIDLLRFTKKILKEYKYYIHVVIHFNSKNKPPIFYIRVI